MISLPVLLQICRKLFLLGCSSSEVSPYRTAMARAAMGNADLLPDIKVNTDAMARTTQLVQEGFVKITE
jgi:hypothetical protein